MIRNICFKVPHDQQHCQSTDVIAQAGLQFAPGLMQLLQTSYDSLDSDAAVMQPYLIHATAAFLDFAKVALLSKE